MENYYFSKAFRSSYLMVYCHFHAMQELSQIGASNSREAWLMPWLFEAPILQQHGIYLFTSRMVDVENSIVSIDCLVQMEQAEQRNSFIVQRCIIGTSHQINRKFPFVRPESQNSPFLTLTLTSDPRSWGAVSRVRHDLVTDTSSSATNKKSDAERVLWESFFNNSHWHLRRLVESQSIHRNQLQSPRVGIK